MQQDVISTDFLCDHFGVGRAPFKRHGALKYYVTLGIAWDMERVLGPILIFRSSLRKT